LDEKVGEAIQEKMKGGAIRKVKKRSPKKDIKIEEALATKMQSGGAIRKPKKKSPRKNPKVEEAIAAKMQGGKLDSHRSSGLRFHDATHKYLHQKLSGRGGHIDTPFVREKMHQLMSAYHPSLFQSYLSGKVRDVPSDPHHALGGPPRPTRRDPRPTVVDTGGSMAALTHSENGILQAFDSTFYNHFELV
jgi:hypothetical protein